MGRARAASSSHSARSCLASARSWVLASSRCVPSHSAATSSSRVPSLPSTAKRRLPGASRGQRFLSAGEARATESSSRSGWKVSPRRCPGGHAAAGTSTSKRGASPVSDPAASTAAVPASIHHLQTSPEDQPATPGARGDVGGSAVSKTACPATTLVSTLCPTAERTGSVDCPRTLRHVLASVSIECSVSALAGETVAITRVLVDPSKADCKRRVSLCSRTGACTDSPISRARRQALRTLKEALTCLDSFRRAAQWSLWSRDHSDPAKSTTVSRPPPKCKR
mmetsp:Transcript_19708/g.55547  ORF Transcript_19708/g.55547 Transcript_19708/m.55547 type:complete len:281 (+) Transcript_19708:192-1034(+)